MWKSWPRYIVVTVSLITPQQKGFEDSKSYHKKKLQGWFSYIFTTVHVHIGTSSLFQGLG